MIRRTITLLVALASLAATAAVAAPAGAASDGYWDYRPIGINGTYQTFVGYFNGDDQADILFYAPGTVGDSIWFGRSGVRGATGFTKKNLTVNGSYQPIVGNFAGGPETDILWYAPGTGADSLWVNDGTGNFTSQAKKIDGTFRGYRVIDYTGKDDILWYNPAKTTSYRWRFGASGDGSVTSFAESLPANAKIVIGDWNGNGHEDVFALGTTDKAIYFTATDTGGAPKSFSIAADYTPSVVYHNPSDGILWFGPGNAADSFWRGTTTTNFQSVPLVDLPLTGRLTPYGVDAVLITSKAMEDAVFYDDGSTADFYDLNDGHEKGDERPIVGDWDGNGYLDILWYAAGSAADELWYSEAPSSAGTSGVGRDAGLVPAPAPAPNRR